MTPREAVMEHLAEAARVTTMLRGTSSPLPQDRAAAAEVVRLDATLAIAGALLDVADAIREFAASERGEPIR